MKPDDAASAGPDDGATAAGGQPQRWQAGADSAAAVQWPRWLRVLGLAALASTVVVAAGLAGGFASGFVAGFAKSRGTRVAPETLLLVSQAGGYGIFAAMALWPGRRSSSIPKADLGWTPVRFDLRLMAAIVGAQVFCGLWVLSTLALFGPVPSTAAQAAGVFDPWLRFALLTVLVVAAPVTEELLFRGWLQARARRLLPRAAAVGLTAVLFASAHYDGSFRKPAAILGLGLATGWLRERSGSLLPGGALHVANNAIAVGLSLAIP